MGELPPACERASSVLGPTCENGVIYYLDKARAALGMQPYRLPPNFVSLQPDQQTLILTNLDRLEYPARLPIVGLNSALTASAEEGVAREGDPFLPASAVDEWRAYESNWAGYSNALMAYYVYAYDDGYGSGNLDCKKPGDGGCWGHRQTITDELGTLSASPSSSPWPTFMGASAGSKNGGPSGAAMIVATSDGSPLVYYSWAQAVAEGAGTYPYDPGTPILQSDALPLALSLVSSPARRGKTRIKIEGTKILVGRPVEVRVSHQHIPCALPEDGFKGPCRWVPTGRKTTRHMVIGHHSEITVAVGEWERAAVHVQTRGFAYGGLHYRSITERTVLIGPKPHR
ncbi:MAG TPA: hypothetical protein VGN84_08110 [Solirubrobacterales bacterium]|nr:hypothetical protein [Solirubrobacterales bacterium]